MRRTLLLGAGLALAGAAPAAAAEVQVRGTDQNLFDPPRVAIAAGDTVRWTFDGTAQPHNVLATSDNWLGFRSPLGPPPVPPVTRVFEAQGVYAYVCEVHQDTMRGEVVVGNPPPPPPPPLSEQPFPNETTVTPAADGSGGLDNAEGGGHFERGGLDTTRPRLRGLATWRSGGRVQLQFRVSEEAAVTARISRRGKRVKVARVRTAGRGAVTLRGLRAGRYTARMRAVDPAGNASRVRVMRFTVR